MTDKEKATFILNLLAKQELKLQGAREAFSFIEAYKWLLQLQKEMDKDDAN